MCTGCVSYDRRAYRFVLRFGIENEKEACVVAKMPNDGAEYIVMGRDGKARKMGDGQETLVRGGDETVTDGRREKSSKERITAAAVDDDDWRPERALGPLYLFKFGVYIIDARAFVGYRIFNNKRDIF